MKRRLSFSSKSSATRITRSLMFYFSIPFSIIFLSFVIIWVNKTAPPNSVPVQETSRCLRFNTTSSPISSFIAAVVPPVPSSAETNLTTGNSNSNISAVTSDDSLPPKDSTLKLAANPLSAPENASSFSGTNSLVSGLQRKENETDDDEQDRGGGELDGNELKTEEQSAAAVAVEQNITPWNKSEEQNAPLTNGVQGKNVPLTNETEEQNAVLSEKQIEQQQWPLMNETEEKNVELLNEVEEQNAPLSENKVEERQWPLMKETEDKNAPLLDKTEGNNVPLLNGTEEQNMLLLNKTEDQNDELSEKKIEEQQWPVMKEIEEKNASSLNEVEEKNASLSVNKFEVQDTTLMNKTEGKNAPLLNETEENNAQLKNETEVQNTLSLNETEEQNAALNENKIEERQWPAMRETEEKYAPLLNEVEEKNAALSDKKIEEEAMPMPLMKKIEEQQNAQLMNKTEDRIEADKSRKRMVGKKKTKKKKTRASSLDQNSQISSSGGLLVEEDTSITKLGGSCDYSTKGRWVKDNNSYPLYTYRSCPFIEKGFNCEGNGRLDTGFMKWRWQPEDCDIPRFNARKMLELMRGKRLVFVGDSLNRNQSQSMVCMLMGSIRGLRVTRGKRAYTFTFVGRSMEYRRELYRSY